MPTPLSERGLNIHRLLFLFSLFVFGYLISITGGIRAASILYHFPFASDNPVAFLKGTYGGDPVIFVQNIYQIVVFGLSALVYLQWYQKAGMFDYIGLNRIHWRQPMLWFAIGTSLLMIAPIDGLAEWNKTLPGMETGPEREASLKIMLRIFFSGSGWSDLWLNLLNVALIPAICEELFFRAAMQNLLLDWIRKMVPAILITAFIFSLIHADMSGIIPRMVAGMILGYIYIRSGNILISILAHFIFNGFTVVVEWLNNRGIIQIGESDSWPWYIMTGSILFLLPVLWFFPKKQIDLPVNE
jgi:membrane protease YdiL (CAAX protease family)